MSWIAVPEGSDFTYANLPYGVFSVGQDARRRIGVAIGESIVDLGAIRHLFSGPLMKENQASALSDTE